MIKKAFAILFVSTLAFNLAACGKSAEEKQAEADRKAADAYWENRRK